MAYHSFRLTSLQKISDKIVFTMIQLQVIHSISIHTTLEGIETSYTRFNEDFSLTHIVAQPCL